MKVECVHCGASGQMDETRIPAGATSLRCPRCKQTFPIPAVETGPEPPPPSPPPVQPPPLPAAGKGLPDLPPPLEMPALPAAASIMMDCIVCSNRFPRNEMVRFGGQWVCAACKPGYVQMLAQGTPRPGDMRYAGFGIRFGAKILDGLILWVVSMLISLGVGFLLPRTSPQVILASSLILYILQIAIAAAYSGYFLGTYRATPGKMACGLAVVSPQGEQISVMRGVGRYFAEMLSSLTLLVGYLMVLFDEEKRALHDRVCNTRVIYK